MFALYFGYNLSHKQISDYETNKLLKIFNERKSIEKLRNSLKMIFEYAGTLKKEKETTEKMNRKKLEM